ncbi:unnamed protein product [Lactuca virosa]|uniref:Protein kinase domain-containing protein n=1 Tax=Lactuca virosa TaxID=75947 RepID=A0AAU9PEI6_9ASTR|nr:unnamed protein product [Lactuca virosa]
MLAKSFMLAMPFLLWVHEARASLAKPGCQERCGNITVPYPYGMGTGCFLNTSFEVSCNESSPYVSPLRFVNNDKFLISEISMESIRIVGKVPFGCINESATKAEKLDALLAVSQPLPVDFSLVMAQMVAAKVVSQSKPMHIRLCHRAQLRGSCLCGKNSECIDSAKGLGHNCRCKNGYSGNPYLHIGCQVIIASVIGIFSFGAIGHYAYKELGRRKENKIKQEFFKRNGGYLLKQHISANKSHVMKIKVYAAKEIEKATDDFSQSRLLGKGGQGTVYKGFLTDGTIVAIKRSNVVDEDQVERFVNEVFILSQINHRNIVKLLGCCLESEVPLLVYEYLSNGTLSQHLHDGAEVSKFSWKDRIRVARDVAGALAYLHSYASPAIFHRDVKPHNILLDENYRAVVSDFGLSRSIPLSRTHLTTKIEGTFGYLDPEYFRSGQLTEKSDVYAFGVVLMELLTRRTVVSSTNCGEGLVSHFQFLVKQKRVLEILDQQVLDEALMDDIFQVTKLVKTCMRKNVKERQSMKEVVMGLDKLKVVQLELPS